MGDPVIAVPFYRNQTRLTLFFRLPQVSTALAWEARDFYQIRFPHRHTDVFVLLSCGSLAREKRVRLVSVDQCREDAQCDAGCRKCNRMWIGVPTSVHLASAREIVSFGL